MKIVLEEDDKAQCEAILNALDEAILAKKNNIYVVSLEEARLLFFSAYEKAVCGWEWCNAAGVRIKHDPLFKG